MRKLQILLVVFLMIALTGCNKGNGGSANKGDYAVNQSQTAYGLTHGGYVGKAVITVNEAGEISVDIDDAFLLHVLALVNIEEEKWNENNTVSFLSHGEEKHVAKYIEYNDVVYIAIAVGEGFTYVEADGEGMAYGSVDLEREILKNQASMAQYYELVPKGKLKVLDGFNGQATAVITTSYGGLTKKAAPGYWNFGQTWVGNIEEIEKFIEKNGVQFSLNDMVHATEPNEDGLKFWTVADAVTGATNVDFKDYFGLVQLAAGRLKTNK